MTPTVTKSSRQPVALEKKDASEFAFKSRLDGPISELSVLRRSLLFAEISMAAYLPPEQCNIAAGKLGFTDGKFFDFGGPKAYWFQNEFDSVVVFRGIEVHQWTDIAADANALAALSETVGNVHCGFKSAVDEIWPRIETQLEKNTKSVWFCGHSIGGALATICAGRCMLSYIKTEPEGLFTFGSPRVGCKRYVNHVKLAHYRWVNNSDVVTCVPSAFVGYRHSGTEMYIDRLGRLKDLQGWRRISDRIQWFLSGLGRLKTDQLSDHSSLGYIDAIFKIVRSEENKPNSRFAKPGVTVAGSQPDAALVTQNESPDVNESKQQMSA